MGQAAQARLEQKQDKLKATENHTQPEKCSETLDDIITRIDSKVELFTEEEVKQESIEPWAHTGIPKLYESTSFDTFKGSSTMLIEAIKNTTGDMVLYGVTGCGKTHLAISYLQEKQRGFFVPVPELLLEIRDTFRDSSTIRESDVIKKYTDHDLLVLDDLGSEKSTDYSITTLYLIIDRRIRNKKQTIITTNLTLGEIDGVLSARIASRLSGMRVIQVNMPDYRKKR
jgi:DNA replication protein DnaC